tara:strand:+ start:92 stop:409 length:318 start_codon:yes stop_codon:yes gene_type:complete
MLKKKLIFLLILNFLLTSCADTWSSVKRGVTGEKQRTSDEFLVQKKDPLILPPDFDRLPTPQDEIIKKEEVTTFEKTLKSQSLVESDTPSDGSAETSILEQIRKQ